jgi:heat shock protein HspQ
MSTKPPQPPRAPRKATTASSGAPKRASPRAKTSGINLARYRVGDVVKHRVYPFRGIIFDIDPVFNSTEEWWQSIPEEIRPRKDQPFYHLLAENAETEYVAYVSEQNLLPDTSGEPLRHPKVAELFVEAEDGQYKATFIQAH